MDCVHIKNNVDVAKVEEVIGHNVNHQCRDCDETENLWLCVKCGASLCGRYANQHGLRHFEQQEHAVVMHMSETSLFCYKCDDFVINDASVENLRQLVLANSSPAGILPPQSNSPVKRRAMKRRRGSDASRSGSSGSENVLPKSSKVIATKVTSKVSKREARKTQGRRLVGLRNLGNTCFMSAVLQSLSNINEFCKVLKELPTMPSEQKRVKNNCKMIEDGAIVTEELRKVLLALNSDEKNGKKGKSSISPEALFHVIWKVVPRFRGYQQQDAHEFLRYMLDRLHTELLSLLPGSLTFALDTLTANGGNDIYSKSAKRLALQGLSRSSQSLVTALFGGTLQSEVTCLVCSTSSKKHDPFLDLSVDIPSNFVSARKSKSGLNDGDENDKKKACQLQDCLAKFTDVEELSESERFFCSRCSRKQPSTKKFWVRRLPNVLCLHIKRFRWGLYTRTKLETHVQFPQQGLDMSAFLLNNLHETRRSNAMSAMYDLAAIIVHHGTGAGSGHYTAFVTKDGSWYHFNDSSVSATEWETVAKSNAYILFYIQRHFKLPNT